MSTNEPYEHDRMQDEETLDRARELVSCMERGDMTQATELIRDLGRVREDSLFFQIGRLTRELHDSLKSFNEDSSVVNLTDVDLPDARTRLNFVIEKTDQAANRVMDNIDKTIPISNMLAEEAKSLHQEWSKFKRRELTVDEFRHLYGRMMQFLESAEEKSNIIQTNLNDVVLAQDFQDITGQVIRRVINLVTHVEDSLVRLVRLSAEAQLLSGRSPSVKVKAQQVDDVDIAPAGPRVDGLKESSKEVMKNQDDVDDLLSSLGF